jgi:hypothetical protein
LRSGKDTLGALNSVAEYLSDNSLIKTEIARLGVRLGEGTKEADALVQFGDGITSPAAEQMAISLALSNLAPGKLYHMLEQAVLVVREKNVL